MGSKNTKNLYDQQFFDVVVVGGVVGCAVAGELSKYKNIKILVLEKEQDLAQGQTKKNYKILK